MAETGRPTKRTPEVIQRIVDGLSAGTPLAVICRADDMPADRTVRDWIEADADLSADIARARELGFDQIAFDALTIADTPQIGEIVTEKPIMVDGKPLDGVSVREVKSDDMLGHRRLQVETRLKLLAKWDPKRYGELVKHAGPNGDDPIPAAVQVSFVKTNAPNPD